MTGLSPRTRERVVAPLAQTFPRLAEAAEQSHRIAGQAWLDRRPFRIERATWQAGVSRGNARFKVMFFGEPSPDIIAANDRQGWVVFQSDAEITRVPFGPDKKGVPVTRLDLSRPYYRAYGLVDIVVGDR